MSTSEAATTSLAAAPIDPPGPVLWNPITAGRDMLRDPLGRLVADWREYGDVIRTRIGPLTYYGLVHPDHLQHVLQENNRNYVKGPIIARTKILIGDGLFTSEGEFWRRQRRLAQPTFHRQRIGGFATTMTTTTGEMLDAWSQGAATTGEAFDLAEEMSRVTLRIVGRALFSLDLQESAATVGHALVDALEIVTRRAFTILPLPLRVPTADNRRFVRARRELDEVVLRIIAQRRAQSRGNAEHRDSAQDYGDLLSMLLEARDPDTGEGMTDRQLRDEVMTFVLAGHETTAVTLAWVWYLLGRHPEIEQRLRDEIAAAVGQRVPTADDLPALRYVRMVIDETMRLYPPVWAFGRQALADDRVGPFRIKAGTPVNLAVWLTHRHPDFWPDPERFDPERFAPERTAARHRFAYLPFSGGPRLCIGNEFALMELVLVVTMMAQRFRIEPLDRDRVIEPLVRVTLRPQGGVPVRVRSARSGA
jgi:cytochrome P450